MNIEFILGDVKSGKTNHAITLINKQSQFTHKQKIYIATAQIFDPEMQARVRQHQRDRDESWLTLEAPLELSTIIQIYTHPNHILLIDSVSLWLQNHFRAEHDLSIKCSELLEILQKAKENKTNIVLVSDNFNLAQSHSTELVERSFYDQLNILNQKIKEISQKTHHI